MAAFIIRRLLSIVPVVFGVALIVFFLFHLVGGDPTYQMLGKYATAEQITDLRRDLGLDQPYYIQFFDYLRQIVTFDFGRSYSTRQKISEMILSGIGPSLSIAVPMFFVTLFLGIGLSLLVSYFRGRAIDRLIVLACVAGMSLTSLAYILFGQYFLAYRWGWFPISGYESTFPENIQYVLLPALIWVVVALGVDVRFYRTAILDEVHQDYVRTARAKGLGEVRIFLKHVLKNSLIPIITYVVIQIPFLILGSLLLENFFGIPGLGSLIVDAVNHSDFPVLKAMSILVSILFIFGQLVTDILYSFVDPRVRFQS